MVSDRLQVLLVQQCFFKYGVLTLDDLRDPAAHNTIEQLHFPTINR